MPACITLYTPHQSLPELNLSIWPRRTQKDRPSSTNHFISLYAVAGIPTHSLLSVLQVYSKLVRMWESMQQHACSCWLQQLTSMSFQLCTPPQAPNAFSQTCSQQSQRDLWQGNIRVPKQQMTCVSRTWVVSPGNISICCLRKV